MGIEIGEAVLWRRKKAGGALAKLTSLWEDGIFLGVMGKSNELIIGDGNGDLEDKVGAQAAFR